MLVAVTLKRNAKIGAQGRNRSPGLTKNKQKRPGYMTQNVPPKNMIQPKSP
jgi:hypothetical protein